jgi:hypothetical protein
MPRESKDSLGIFSKGGFMKPYNPIQQSSRGLGDSVAKVFKKLGIDKKPGCGCEKRQEMLNKLVPYKKGSK